MKRAHGNGRFAYDSYRRFIQMFGNVVLEIEKDEFEHEFEARQAAARRQVDTDLDEADLQAVVARLQESRLVADEAETFPQDPLEQLAHGARRRVPLLAEPARRATTAASTRSPTTSAPR